MIMINYTYMLDLFEPILNLFRRESPQERYARECYEYEQRERKEIREQEIKQMKEKK